MRIPAFSDQARVALSQYIARPPLSLKKIGIEENGDATAVSFTSQSEFFKGKTETFPVVVTIAGAKISVKWTCKDLQRFAQTAKRIM